MGRSKVKFVIYFVVLIIYGHTDRCTADNSGNSIVGKHQQQQLRIRRNARRPSVDSTSAHDQRNDQQQQQQIVAAAASSNNNNNNNKLSMANRQAMGSLETATSVEQQSTALTVNRPPSSIIRNVTAQNGQSILLHCLVEPSGELVVSWFRGTGEPQLLTYETNTVIDDSRFVVRHGHLKDDDWALEIKNLDKATDSGLYQCQTNSEPPQSQFYQLTIVEPQVSILGAPDLAVKLGSSINLTCFITQAPGPLNYIFWYKGDRMINYDINERGKIVISKWAQNRQDSQSSNLQIFHSKLHDSGNYTCAPAGARPISIYVHVLEGLDKRLIMFQNDNYEPSAASSQQTNSALSVHVIRLSRGRVYALFVAYVIVASWFQIVAQAQTVISLLLLSIIGFFLGKVTDHNNGNSNYQVESNENKKAEEANLVSGGAKTGGKSGSQESPESIHRIHSTIDPLIERANSALNLLKSLSSSSSSGSDDDDEDEEEEESILESSDKQVMKKELIKAQQQVNALNSPSGVSTSSSSASTGYNSDSRSTNLIVVHPVHTNPDSSSLHHKRRCRNNNNIIGNTDECEMIELVTEPTAMNLVMEEFTHTNQHLHQKHRPIKLKSSSSISLGSPIYSNQTTNSHNHLNTGCYPIKPPRITDSIQTTQSVANNTTDLDEPYYASPTNSLYRRQNYNTKNNNNNTAKSASIQTTIRQLPITTNHQRKEKHSNKSPTFSDSSCRLITNPCGGGATCDSHNSP